MTDAPRAASIPSVWLVVAGVGLAVGAAAVLLSGIFVSSPSGVTVNLGFFGPASQVALGIIEVLPIVIVVVLLLIHFSGSRMPVPTRLLAPVLVVILLLVVFVILAHLGVIAVGNTGANTPGLNGTATQNQSNNENITHGNGSVPGGTTTLFGLALPTWAAFALIAAVIVAVAVAVTVYALRPPFRARQRAIAVTGLDARSALGAAARALAEPSSDPRGVLIALYGQLLSQIEPEATDLETSTPREIRTRHLVRLGVQPRTAEAITQLFERARYSSHPIGPEEVARARTVLDDALHDLDRSRAR